MKVYLVGGAVRDELLGKPVHERDWVVVGSQPDVLLQQGYQQVGRGFPVFLHPQTREEYALARTEKKQAPGFYGFTCDFNPEVTLEEDLARRDLTINAMAKDDAGRIIDPYQGQKDIQDKVLRHVSAAFVEDPVRVLRVARFAARFHCLGFTLAPETRCLMYSMVQNKELDHLIPERVWQEWQRSLLEKNPEIFITTLRACGALKVILPELDDLFGVPNFKADHPEVDSGIHSLIVLKRAADLSQDPEIRFAALLRDLGKAKTPIAQWPSHPGHEKEGISVIESLCRRLRIPVDYSRLAKMNSQFHLDIHRFSELTAESIVNTLEQIDAFRRPQLLDKLLLVCEANAQSEQGLEYRAVEQWHAVFKSCQDINVQSLLQQGYQGAAIKLALHENRIKKVQLFLK